MAVAQTAANSVTVTQNAASVGRYDIYELTMENAAQYDNPWEDPSITAEFTSPTGSTFTVGGFLYDLKEKEKTNIWKVRFAPPAVGAWSWTLSFANTMGKSPPFVTSGKFTCGASANSGFLRIHPCNNGRFMTEGDGKAFYPLGGYYWTPPGVTDLHQANWITDSFAQPCDIDDFMRTWKKAGQNMASGQVSSYVAFQMGAPGGPGFNVKGTGKNNYRLDYGLLLDSYMAAIHRADWKFVMPLGRDPGGYIKDLDLDSPKNGPGLKRAWLNYHQYIINRYGAYVDIWRPASGGAADNDHPDKEPLDNSQTLYSEMMASYMRAHDPYRHLMATDRYPSRNTGLDVVCCIHKVVSSNLDWQVTMAKPFLPEHAYANTSTGLTQPILPDGWAEHDVLCPSPSFYRMTTWISFFNRGSVLFSKLNEFYSSEERAYSKIFTDYIADFDPAAKPVSVELTPAEQLTCYALSSPVDLGIYLLHKTSQNSVLAGAAVKVKVPSDNMQGQWLDPTTGLFLQQPLTLQAGEQAIPIPPFKNDVVLRLRAGVPSERLQFAKSSYRVNSDQSSVALTVNRLGRQRGAVSVRYATQDGLAKAGRHYQATSGTLSWGADEGGAKTITVPLIKTNLLRADSEFYVSLSDPTGGAALGTANNALVTIANVITNTAMLEPTYVAANGSGKLEFSAKRIGNGVGPLTVYCSTHRYTASDKIDYAGVALKDRMKLEWADGDMTSKTFSVTILSNSSSTEDKVFSVALDNIEWLGDLPVLYPLLPMVAGSSPPPGRRSTVVIQANPKLSPGIVRFSGYSGAANALNIYPANGLRMDLDCCDWCASAATYTASKTETLVSIPVSRIGGSHGKISVKYATHNTGTAAANINYVPVEGTLSWADGETADKIIKVPLIHNPAEIGNMTMWLVLRDPKGGTLLQSMAAAMVTIVDPESK